MIAPSALTLSREDVWKLVAIALMTVDHVGWLFFPDTLWMRAIGRLCLPVWLFFAGYHADSNRWRPMAIAIVMVTLFDSMMGEYGATLPPLSILVTIYLCKKILHLGWLEHALASMPLGVAMGCAVFAPLTSLIAEYGSGVFLFAAFGYAVHQGHGIRYSWVLWLAATVSLLALHQIFFAFDLEQNIFIATAVMLICWMLSRFTPGELHLPLPRIIIVAMRLLGRNSLMYYVLHKMALQGAAKFF